MIADVQPVALPTRTSKGHFIKENVLCKDGDISNTISNIYGGDYRG